MLLNLEILHPNALRLIPSSIIHEESVQSTVSGRTALPESRTTTFEGPDMLKPRAARRGSRILPTKTSSGVVPAERSHTWRKSVYERTNCRSDAQCDSSLRQTARDAANARVTHVHGRRSSKSSSAVRTSDSTTCWHLVSGGDELLCCTQSDTC